MPHRPPSPCAHVGCRELTHDRFCPKHAKEEAAHYERYERDRELKALYDQSAWRRLRRRYLSQHPLCQECEAVGRLIPAQEVHHVKPVAEGGPFLEWGNLRALCKSCHSHHHAAARGRSGVPGG